MRTKMKECGIDSMTPTGIIRARKVKFDQAIVNARTKFKYQLEIIKIAITEKCVVIGYFNLTTKVTTLPIL